MNMIKGFNEEEQVLKAKQLIYEDVHFPNGFNKFLDALQIEHIIKKESKRCSIPTGYQWINEVRLGGIQLETSDYPYKVNNPAGELVVIGSMDNIEMVHSILERHGVQYKGKTTPEDIELNIQYHSHLNPALWVQQDDEYILLDEVQEALEDLSQAFYEFLDMPDLDVEDLTLTGSSANFNWTEDSDLDVHLVVDMKKSEKTYGKLCVQYFDAMKTVWNELHDIKIKGIPVEFYVQDDKEVHNSTGVYSIMNEEWVVEPKHEEPDFDDSAVRLKAAEWARMIKEVTAVCNKADVIEKLMKKLSKLRQAGLDKAGEFSVENLAFKTLRNEGYLDLLADCKTRAFDRELSIEEEEWCNLK